MMSPIADLALALQQAALTFQEICYCLVNSRPVLAMSLTVRTVMLSETMLSFCQSFLSDFVVSETALMLT